MNKSLGSVLCAVIIEIFAGRAVATENGLTSYPIGVSTVLTGILPPPGDTRFYSYTEYYESSKLTDSAGKSSLPGFHASVFVEAPRIVHTWDTMLGPFTMSSDIIVPIFHLTTAVPGAWGARTAVGDVILAPLHIGFKSADSTLFSYLGFDIAMPTGAYSTSRVANPGRNVFAFIPNLNVTWFPRKQLELSFALGVEMATMNRATEYQSGNVATFEYLIGYSVTPKIQLGLQGYYLDQFTNDRQDGRIVLDGFRGRALGIGPQIRYNFSPAVGVAIKYQRELLVQNRPEGNRFWLEVTFPIR